MAYYPGAGTTAIYEYTQNLAKLGYETHVIVAGKKGEGRQENINGVRIHRVITNNLRPYSISNLKFIFYALKMIKKNSFDVIHIYYNPGIFLLPIIFKNKNTKWVYDIRSVTIDANSLKSFLKIKIKKLGSLFFDKNIVIDKEVSRLIFGSQKTAIVPLGANFEIFKPAKNIEMRKKLNVREGELLILYSGIIDSRRRPQEVIYGFKNISEKIDKVKLTLVGGGPYLKELKRLANKLKLEDKVLFTGEVDYFKMPEYLNAADIGISYIPKTTGYNVQPPLKTVEYLACQLVTIATNTLGNKRFLKDGFNGILVEDNAVDLSDKIINLIENPKTIKKLSKNSRKLIIDYNWNVIVTRKLLPVYNNILKTSFSKKVK